MGCGACAAVGGDRPVHATTLSSVDDVMGTGSSHVPLGHNEVVVLAIWDNDDEDEGCSGYHVV